uniref:2-isopropylmalate synthase n=1 Tax=Anthurium amnicola TaxID=1678845 RepID=A0A1D1XLC1_9ARAE
MQGARHDQICVSNLSNFLCNDIRQMYHERINSNNIPPKESHVSTELNIGCVSQSESSSPLSQNSVFHCGSELFGHSAANTPANVIGGSFQLFGKTIQMGKPVVADVKEQCNNNTVSVRPYNASLSYPQMQFHDGHSGQSQRIPAVTT